MRYKSVESCPGVNSLGTSPPIGLGISYLRHFLTERYRNCIFWYLDVFPLWCQHFQYLGCHTGALKTNFARKRVKPRYLTLFRTTKNCVVICRASLLYEMGCPFHSALLVPMELRTFFATTCQGSFLKKSCSNLVNQYQPTRLHRTEEVSNNFP